MAFSAMSGVAPLLKVGDMVKITEECSMHNYQFCGMVGTVCSMSHGWVGVEFESTVVKNFRSGKHYMKRYNPEDETEEELAGFEPVGSPLPSGDVISPGGECEPVDLAQIEIETQQVSSRNFLGLFIC